MGTPNHNTHRAAVTDDQRARMAKAYAEGVPMRMLSERFGVSANTILAAAKDAGVPQRQPARVAGLDRDDQIADLRRKGMSEAAIATEIGASQSYVHDRIHALRKTGVLAETLFDAAAGTERRPLPMVETPPPRKCAWPLWGHHERPSHMYCGAASEPGRSYCGEHCAKAFTAPEKAAGTFRLLNPGPNKSKPVAPTKPSRSIAKVGRHTDRTVLNLDWCRTERERTIAALWNDGRSQESIGNMTQQTAGAVAGVLNRIRARDPQKAKAA